MYDVAAQGFPVTDMTGPEVSFPQVPLLTEADADRGIVGRFRQVVTAEPDAVAVSDEHDRLSFHGLAELAASVRGAIDAAVGRLGGPVVRTAEGSPGGPDPVAVLYGHEVAAVGAILGVIASGHPLLVLDPRAPEARLRQLIDLAGARVVVCGPTTQEAAAWLAEQVVVVGQDTAEVPVERLWADPPRAGTVATLEPASGMTGRHALIAADHRTLVLEPDAAGAIAPLRIEPAGSDRLVVVGASGQPAVPINDRGITLPANARRTPPVRNGWCIRSAIQPGPPQLLAHCQATTSIDTPATASTSVHVRPTAIARASQAENAVAPRSSGS